MWGQHPTGRGPVFTGPNKRPAGKIWFDRAPFQDPEKASSAKFLHHWPTIVPPFDHSLGRGRNAAL
jgi:hypothetical protein